MRVREFMAKAEGKLAEKVAVLEYRGRTGDVFDVTVDDDHFRMTFLNYPLGPYMVERIEGRREPETTATIRALLRPGHRVLELGGCYGYFTMIMSRSVGRDGRVMSVEGLPNNFAILTENLRLNGIENVDPVHQFVAEQEGEIAFRHDERNPYAGIDRFKAGQNTGEVRVPAGPISTLLTERGFVPQFVFADIEGFEVDLFEDLASHWLREHQPTFVFETHEPFYEPGRDLGYITKLLGAAGYQWKRMGTNLLAWPV